MIAAKLGDLALIRQRTRELDEYLASHAPPLDDDARTGLARTRDALHALLRGDYTLGDPCTQGPYEVTP